MFQKFENFKLMTKKEFKILKLITKRRASLLSRKSKLDVIFGKQPLKFGNLCHWRLATCRVCGLWNTKKLVEFVGVRFCEWRLATFDFERLDLFTNL